MLAFGSAERRDLPWRRTREPWAILGQDFRLDSELIERLIPIEGLANVALTARPDRHLRLVE